MAQDTNIQGGASSVKAEVDANNNLYTRSPQNDAAGVSRGGGYLNAPANFNEIDDGTYTGTRDMLSPETDDDYRQRQSNDNILDQQSFTAGDTAQYTDKFYHAFLTLTATQSTAGLLMNSGNITTTTTGMTHGTHAYFKASGTETLVIETAAAFSAQPSANQTIYIGAFIRGAANPFTPVDGPCFALTSAGMQGQMYAAGILVATTAVFPLSGGTGTWLYTNNTVYRFLIQMTNVRTTFWINNFKYATINTPIGQGYPCNATGLPWSVAHSIVGGAAGSANQTLIKDYRVFIRGPQYSDSMAACTSRVVGAYRGATTATLGTIGTYTNSTNPTAAVPSNTSLTVGAAGLLNQAWETFTLAVNTDGILQSYQNPAGTASAPGRRLRIVGVKLSSFVQTVLAGGPCIRTFALNFGHTSVSLATAESASFANGTTKQRRVILLPELTQAITAAQAVSTMISQPGGTYSWLPESTPTYINPGEFVAVSEKIIGTVGTSGTIVNHIQVIAAPE